MLLGHQIDSFSSLMDTAEEEETEIKEHLAEYARHVSCLVELKQRFFSTHRELEAAKTKLTKLQNERLRLEVSIHYLKFVKNL
ncbi:unnamed protein product [Protopolystoma xenopodis]|uniref:Uncharacterized protein n=1 Tax=Protopolystoma xenopodis TaxID=117903 RepID=A0A3S5FG52_9PLAT|nr:unnamed protein product [Protopolystoma xenopodis]